MIRVTRPNILDFMKRLDGELGNPARVYMTGETTQVFEGWRDWTTEIEFASEVAPREHHAFSRAVAKIAADLGIPAFDESPADLIPLPAGYEERARPATTEPTFTPKQLSIYHFDPYSVAFRFIARGDEPDYHIVLMLLKQGWITMDEMEQKLADLLPRFNAETIQQDPAEFRRKYKSLQQMSRTIGPRTHHRPTPV